jgi:hypothetical protein
MSHIIVQHGEISNTSNNYSSNQSRHNKSDTISNVTKAVARNLF